MSGTRVRASRWPLVGAARVRGARRCCWCPWDPVPGGPLHPPPAVLGVHGRGDPAGRGLHVAGRGSGAGASLAVSLAAWPACWASPGWAPRLVDRVPRSRGGGRSWSRWPRSPLVGRLVTLPFAVAAAAPGARLRPVEPGAGAPTPSTWSRAWRSAWWSPRSRWSCWSACARRWPRAWPAVAGAAAGGAGDARLVRLPAAGRAAVQRLRRRCRTARCAPRSSRWPTSEGVQVDDVLVADASRRTTTLNAYVSGLRVVAAGRRLRQPGRRTSASTTAGRSRWSPTSWPMRGTTTCSPARCSVRPARWSASGCSGCWSGGRGVARRPAAGAAGAGAGRGRDAAGQPGAERHQPADRDSGRRGRAAGHRRPGGVRRGAEASWRAGRWPTRRRRPGRSSGSAATRRRCSGSRSPSGSPTERVRMHVAPREPQLRRGEGVSAAGAVLSDRTRATGSR